MARKAGAKKAKAKKVKITPTYMTGEKPLKIGLHDVIRALKVIEDHGHMRKFATAAKKQESVMLVPPKTVNFVKDFLVKYNMHDDPVGKHIVNAREAPGALATASPAMRAGAAAAQATKQKDPHECDFSND
ncbi:MAG: hypothetical protein ABIL01_32900 [Pseudomonadota bacterium]